jgi:hypothetical protein
VPLSTKTPTGGKPQHRQLDPHKHYQFAIGTVGSHRSLDW